MALSAKSLLTMFAAASALLALTVEARLKIMSPESLSGMFNSKSIAAQASCLLHSCLTKKCLPLHYRLNNSSELRQLWLCAVWLDYHGKTALLGNQKVLMRRV